MDYKCPTHCVFCKSFYLILKNWLQVLPSKTNPLSNKPPDILVKCTITFPVESDLNSLQLNILFE